MFMELREWISIYKYVELVGTSMEIGEEKNTMHVTFLSMSCFKSLLIMKRKFKQ